MRLSECCSRPPLDEEAFPDTCSGCGDKTGFEEVCVFCGGTIEYDPQRTGFEEVCVFCGGTIEYDPQRVVEPDGIEYVEANPYCPECLDNRNNKAWLARQFTRLRNMGLELPDELCWSYGWEYTTEGKEYLGAEGCISLTFGTVARDAITTISGAFPVQKTWNKEFSASTDGIKYTAKFTYANIEFNIVAHSADIPPNCHIEESVETRPVKKLVCDGEIPAPQEEVNVAV